MSSIASTARFRQRVIRYAEKHVVTEASIRHRVSRKATTGGRNTTDTGRV